MDKVQDLVMDARVSFTPDECKILQRFIENKDEINSLKTLNEELTDKVKEIMSNHKTNDAILDGVNFKIIPSKRKQCKRGKKDEFIAELLALGKKYLVETTMEPDMDSISDEVDAGTLDRNLFDKYVTVTDIKTLRTS